MNQSIKLLLASVSPVALAAGWSAIDSAPAHATITVTATSPAYATENFVGASAATSVVVGSTGIKVGSGTTTTDFGVGWITFTLSNGATFAATPSPTRTTNLTLGSGSLVSSSTAVTYQVTSIGSTTSSTITLGNFTLTGVGTRLAASGQGINVTYSSIVGSNNPTTPSGTLAVSSHQYFFTSASTNNSLTIDLANAGAGLMFRSGTANATFVTLGTLRPNASTRTEIDGSTTFAAGGSDVLRAFVAGNLSAFSNVYVATAACAATAPSGAISGTIAADALSATMSPVTLGSNYNFCAVANGTTIIPSGTITGTVAYSFAARTVSGATYTPGATSSMTTTLATLSYNGSTNTAYYVVGSGSYTSAIRLTNQSVSAGSVFVQVIPDTTGAPLRALLDSTLAAGQSKFYFASDIRSAVGTSVLADSNSRATVVFLNAFSDGRLQTFIVNPGGVLSGGLSGNTTATSGN